MSFELCVFIFCIILNIQMLFNTNIFLIILNSVRAKKIETIERHLTTWLFFLFYLSWDIEVWLYDIVLWEAKYLQCILVLSVLWLQNSVDNPHYQSTSPADRPNLRPIPEHLYHQNGHHPGYHNGSDVRWSPPTHRSRSADPYYRDLSPPSHAITAPGAPPQTYVAKGVRANTMVSPLRATGPVTQDTSK